MTIELAPHQREAVQRVRDTLDARGGVILADEVGLGKSYVAAAVASRSRAAIDLVVPAGLIAQWTATLEAFGVAANITSHDRIVSESFAPGRDGERLIIVDEAHAFRNPQTQRYAALARRSIGARLLLVTATPVCNSPDDLRALVALIAADDALRDRGVASIEDAFQRLNHDELLAVMSALVIRRGREVVDGALAFGRLERRLVRHEVFAAPIDALLFPLVGAHLTLLRSVLWRRLESSEAALIESVRRQTRFYQRALDCLASGHTLTKRDYRAAFGDEDQDAFQEVLFWEVFANDAARADAVEIRAELDRLDALRNSVERAPRQKIAKLEEICSSTGEAILIFTSAIATANEVFAAMTRIRRAGVVTSHGAIPSNAIAAFGCGQLDLLVCTDLASEGLNLQAAGVVVHYDLPWNPVKIDQRNGRAFRIGQRRDVVRAVYFLPRGRRTRVAHAVASKNRARRRLFRSSPELPASESLAALPPRIPRSAPAVALVRTLRRYGIQPPAAIRVRHRAGLERLFAEMAQEFVDERRVSDLTLLLKRERIIAGGASIGPVDR